MFEVVYKGYSSLTREVLAVDRDREKNKTYFLIWDFDGFRWVDSEEFDLA